MDINLRAVIRAAIGGMGVVLAANLIGFTDHLLAIQIIGCCMVTAAFLV